MRWRRARQLASVVKQTERPHDREHTGNHAHRGRHRRHRRHRDRGPEELEPDTKRPTHSSAKTIVAAQVLRLVEEGRLSLDDPASGYLPRELAFFDTNGATIRQVLGMRSGIPDLNEYDGFYPAEQAATVAEVFRKLPEPTVSPGSELHYASTNYVLLGTIVEHALGRPLSEAFRSGVLDRTGLDGITYTVGGAGRRRVGGRDDAGVVGSLGLRITKGRAPSLPAVRSSGLPPSRRKAS